MDPMMIAQLGAMGVETISSIVGDVLASGDRQKAMQLYEQLMQKATGLKPPPQQTMQAIEQMESSLTGFKEDPGLRAAQLKALEGLQAEVSAKGMTPEAQAEYNRARLEAGQMAAGMEGAAAERAAQRGLGGMGAYLGALGGSQAAVNRAGQMGVEIAGDARKRYLQALEGLGGLSGQMRGQEFGMAAQRAAAQDAINRFNALQRSEAQQYNLGAGQRDLENQLAILRAQTVAAGGMAGALENQASQTQASAGRYGQAGGSLLRGGGQIAVGRAKRDAWQSEHPGKSYPWWENY